jgi:hypothetical protein
MDCFWIAWYTFGVIWTAMCIYMQGWKICMYETNLTLYLYCTVQNFILIIMCTNCMNCTKLY